MTSYIYSITDNLKSASSIEYHALQNQINDDVSITPSCTDITQIKKYIKILFASDLSSSEVTVLNNIINGYSQSYKNVHYGSLDNDPDENYPSPQTGYRYYNKTINHEMAYDGVRGKWLSVAIFTEGAGKNGQTKVGSFYTRFNGMSLTKTLGVVVPKGTIIYIGYSTASAVNHTYEVLVSGNSISTLNSGGAASASDDTFNDDFDAGNMSSRNLSGSTTTHFQSVIYYKLRS